MFYPSVTVAGLTVEDEPVRRSGGAGSPARLHGRFLTQAIGGAALGVRSGEGRALRSVCRRPGCGSEMV